MIGSNIKKARKIKGISQKKLAEISNIPQISLGRYERGERTPNIDIVRKLANALGVEINELIYSRENQIDDTADTLHKLHDLGLIGDPIEFMENLINNHDTPKNIEYIDMYGNHKISKDAISKLPLSKVHLEKISALSININNIRNEINTCNDLSKIYNLTHTEVALIDSIVDELLVIIQIYSNKVDILNSIIFEE